jgi:DNA-directed RNA polymerase subunit F
MLADHISTLLKKIELNQSQRSEALQKHKQGWDRITAMYGERSQAFSNYLSHLKDSMNEHLTVTIYAILDFAESESQIRNELGPVLPNNMEELTTLFEMAKKFIREFMQEVDYIFERSQKRS